MICSFLEEWLSFFDMESGFSHDIPTTVHRSKADCPEPEEMVTVSVDGAVLDRIGKIMSYLRLGSSGKILKKKKDKDGKGAKLTYHNIEFPKQDTWRLFQAIHGFFVSTFKISLYIGTLGCFVLYYIYPCTYLTYSISFHLLVYYIMSFFFFFCVTYHHHHTHQIPPIAKAR
ncbi:putative RED-like protein [Helianthus annuus]|nr:putative RED-like protein [Helianthus annuus]KAJ0864670.1 putative RED-like protein [Helianthus annuus]